MPAPKAKFKNMTESGSNKHFLTGVSKTVLINRKQARQGRPRDLPVEHRVQFFQGFAVQPVRPSRPSLSTHQAAAGGHALGEAAGLHSEPSKLRGSVSGPTQHQAPRTPQSFRSGEAWVHPPVALASPQRTPRMLGEHQLNSRYAVLHVFKRWFFLGPAWWLNRLILHLQVLASHMSTGSCLCLSCSTSDLPLC